MTAVGELSNQPSSTHLSHGGEHGGDATEDAVRLGPGRQGKARFGWWSPATPGRKPRRDSLRPRRLNPLNASGPRSPAVRVGASRANKKARVALSS